MFSSLRNSVGFGYRSIARVLDEEIAVEDESEADTCEVRTNLPVSGNLSRTQSREQCVDSWCCCRMHAQALTLAVLSSAAIMHYYDDAKRPASAIDDDEKSAHTSLA